MIISVSIYKNRAFLLIILKYLMIGKFKKQREQQEEAESKKNTTDVVTA